MRPLTTLLLAVATLMAQPLTHANPVRFAIVGLSHDHAHGFIPTTSSRTDVELVAIVEPNPQLAQRFAKQYQLKPSLLHSDLDTMLDTVKPQAVATFTSTFQHLEVVQACAKRGIHVMMEKPLAVSMDHARAMQSAVRNSGIHLIVNFETTWYPSNHEAYRLAHQNQTIGELRKIVVHDGHQGPREIGCSEDFLAWLTDPVLNGGGALTDFGCYGANLITWLMQNQRPTSVLAVTQQIKPHVYPKVDDEATILLTYPKAQGIIQASWNWPYNRKDMEVYGAAGYAIAPDSKHLRLRIGNNPEQQLDAPPLPSPNHDPLAYLAAVCNGEIAPSGLSSLEVNMIATEILDAARQSAQTGQRINLPQNSR